LHEARSFQGRCNSKSKALSPRGSNNLNSDWQHSRTVKRDAQRRQPDKAYWLRKYSNVGTDNLQLGIVPNSLIYLGSD
jgi:hypothetical protein